MSNPTTSNPESPVAQSPQRKGVGCLPIAIMAVLVIAGMLALIALLGDPA